jgi:hypothetical protein
MGVNSISSRTPAMIALEINYDFDIRLWKSYFWDFFFKKSRFCRVYLNRNFKLNFFLFRWKLLSWKWKWIYETCRQFEWWRKMYYLYLLSQQRLEIFGEFCFLILILEKIFRFSISKARSKPFSFELLSV